MKEDDKFQKLKNPTHEKKKENPQNEQWRDISIRQSYSKPREQLIQIRADQKVPGEDEIDIIKNVLKHI